MEFKIGYFTLDNARNNDTALCSLSQKLAEIGIVFDPIAHRLRCLSHVINLVVRAFMYGTGVDAFELDIASLHTHQKEVDELVAWRKRGALGTLHNVCVWICRTPQRRDEFAEYVKRNLGAGVNTLSRWLEMSPAGILTS